MSTPGWLGNVVSLLMMAGIFGGYLWIRKQWIDFQTYGKGKMTDEERVAKRMFEAHARTTTYETPPWDKATEPVKKVWLLMAREALDEMEK